MKEKIKNKIKREYGIFKQQISIPEYIFWWICRAIMIYTVVTTYISPSSGHFDLQMRANTIFLFILPYLHILPRKFTFLARLHHRAQTIVCFMVICTSYLGNFVDVYNMWEYYDTFIHFVAGVICVPVGYYLLEAFSREGEKHSPLAKTVAGFGLSCFASLFWECYEFIFDWIMGSTTQGWSDTPPAELIERFPTDPGRYPLFDTMTDEIAGFLGAFVTSLIMRAVLEYAEYKSKKVSSPEIAVMK